MSGDTFLGQFRIQPFDFGLYVKMDSSACRALHLSQNTLESTSKNSMTLLSVIDKCRTAQVLPAISGNIPLIFVFFYTVLIFTYVYHRDIVC